MDPGDLVKSAKATCPPGTQVINGGYTAGYADFLGLRFSIVDSYADRDGWFVNVRRTLGSGPIIVYAYCAEGVTWATNAG
jgi:hypothetical protein